MSCPAYEKKIKEMQVYLPRLENLKRKLQKNDTSDHGKQHLMVVEKLLSTLKDPSRIKKSTDKLNKLDLMLQQLLEVPEGREKKEEGEIRSGSSSSTGSSRSRSRSRSRSVGRPRRNYRQYFSSSTSGSSSDSRSSSRSPSPRGRSDRRKRSSKSSRRHRSSRSGHSRSNRDRSKSPKASKSTSKSKKDSASVKNKKSESSTSSSSKQTNSSNKIKKVENKTEEKKVKTEDKKVKTEEKKVKTEEKKVASVVNKPKTLEKGESSSSKKSVENKEKEKAKAKKLDATSVLSKIADGKEVTDILDDILTKQPGLKESINRVCELNDNKNPISFNNKSFLSIKVSLNSGDKNAVFDAYAKPSPVPESPDPKSPDCEITSVTQKKVTNETKTSSQTLPSSSHKPATVTSNSLKKPEERRKSLDKPPPLLTEKENPANRPTLAPFVPLVKQQSQDNCKYCGFQSHYLINHYVNHHPNHEIPVLLPDHEMKEILKLEAIKKLPSHGSGQYEMPNNPDTSWIPNMNVFPQPIKCIHCQYQTKFKIELKNHVTTHYDATGSLRRGACNISYTCRFCSIICNNIYDFKDHVTAHTGEFSYSCGQCNFKGHSARIMKEHICAKHPCMDCKINRTATESKVSGVVLYGFVCTRCSYIQLSEETVKLHVKREHRGEKVEVLKIDMSAKVLPQQVVRPNINVQGGPRPPESVAIPPRRDIPPPKENLPVTPISESDSKKIASPTPILSPPLNAKPALLPTPNHTPSKIPPKPALLPLPSYLSTTPVPPVSPISPIQKNVSQSISNQSGQLGISKPIQQRRISNDYVIPKKDPTRIAPLPHQQETRSVLDQIMEPRKEIPPRNATIQPQPNPIQIQPQPKPIQKEEDPYSRPPINKPQHNPNVDSQIINEIFNEQTTDPVFNKIPLLNCEDNQVRFSPEGTKIQQVLPLPLPNDHVRENDELFDKLRNFNFDSKLNPRSLLPEEKSLENIKEINNFQNDNRYRPGDAPPQERIRMDDRNYDSRLNDGKQTQDMGPINFPPRQPLLDEPRYRHGSDSDMRQNNWRREESWNQPKADNWNDTMGNRFRPDDVPPQFNRREVQPVGFNEFHRGDVDDRPRIDMNYRPNPEMDLPIHHRDFDDRIQNQGGIINQAQSDYNNYGEAGINRYNRQAGPSRQINEMRPRFGQQNNFDNRFNQNADSPYYNEDNRYARGGNRLNHEEPSAAADVDLRFNNPNFYSRQDHGRHQHRQDEMEVPLRETDSGFGAEESFSKSQDENLRFRRDNYDPRYNQWDNTRGRGTHIRGRGDINIRGGRGETHIRGGRGDIHSRGRGDTDIRGRGDTHIRGRGDIDIRGRGDTHIRGRGDTDIRGRDMNQRSEITPRNENERTRTKPWTEERSKWTESRHERSESYHRSHQNEHEDESHSSHRRYQSYDRKPYSSSKRHDEYSTHSPTFSESSRRSNSYSKDQDSRDRYQKSRYDKTDDHNERQRTNKNDLEPEKRNESKSGNSSDKPQEVPEEKSVGETSKDSSENLESSSVSKDDIHIVDMELESSTTETDEKNPEECSELSQVSESDLPVRSIADTVLRLQSQLKSKDIKEIMTDKVRDAAKTTKIKIEKPPKEKYPEKSDFNCGFPNCSFYATTCGFFEKHLRSHPNAEKYPCCECKRSYPSVLGLVEHIKWYCPVREYRYSCNMQFCTYKTSRGEVYKNHINKTHKNNMSFTCVVCSKVVNSSSKYVTHLTEVCLSNADPELSFSESEEEEKEEEIGEINIDPLIIDVDSEQDTTEESSQVDTPSPNIQNTSSSKDEDDDDETDKEEEETDKDISTEEKVEETISKEEIEKIDSKEEKNEKPKDVAETNKEENEKLPLHVVYKCPVGKCNHKSLERQVFLAHITRHDTEDQQNMECFNCKEVCEDVDQLVNHIEEKHTEKKPTTGKSSFSIIFGQVKSKENDFKSKMAALFEKRKAPVQNKETEVASKSPDPPSKENDFKSKMAALFEKRKAPVQNKDTEVAGKSTDLPIVISPEKTNKTEEKESPKKKQNSEEIQAPVTKSKESEDGKEEVKKSKTISESKEKEETETKEPEVNNGGDVFPIIDCSYSLPNSDDWQYGEEEQRITTPVQQRTETEPRSLARKRIHTGALTTVDKLDLYEKMPSSAGIGVPSDSSCSAIKETLLVLKDPKVSQSWVIDSSVEDRNISWQVNHFKPDVIAEQMLEEGAIQNLFKCIQKPCSFSSEEREDFCKHLKERHSHDTPTCLYCTQKCATARLLAEHIAIHHGASIYQCAYCFYRSSVETYVVLHQIHLHGSNPVKIFTCKKPEGSVEPGVPSNLEDVVLKYTCCLDTHTGESCQFQCVDANDFRMHFSSKHPGSITFPCGICKTIFANYEGLLSHYEGHKISDYQCVYCLHGAENERQILYHLAYRHADKGGYLVIRNYKIEKESPEKSQNKEKVMSGPKEGRPFLYCGFSRCRFKADVYQELQNHMKTCPVMETSGRPVCQLCGTMYTNAKSYLEHLLTHGEKRFYCCFCPHQAALAQDVKKHIIAVHKVKVTEIDCIPKGSNTDLNSGEFTIQPKANFPVYSPDDIDRLPQQHIFQMYVKCSLCNFCSKVRSMFIRHLTTIHKDEIPTPKKAEPESENIRPSPSVIYSPAKSVLAPPAKPELPQFVDSYSLFECGFDDCEYKAQQQDMYLYHMHTLHGTASAFPCPHCQTVVFSLPQLKAHFKFHGPSLYKCAICDFCHCNQGQVFRHMVKLHPSVGLKPEVIRAPPEKVSANPDFTKILNEEMGEPKKKKRRRKKKGVYNDKKHVKKTSTPAVPSPNKVGRKKRKKEEKPATDMETNQDCLILETNSPRRLTRSSKIEQPEAEIKYMCNLCKVFKTDKKIALRSHLIYEMGYKRFRCSGCLRRFFKEKEVQKHLNEVKHPFSENPIIEIETNEEAERKIDYFMANATIIDNTAPPKLTPEQVQEPTKEETEPKRKSNKEQSESVGVCYVCPVCNREINHATKFRHHLYAHRNYKPLVCAYCDLPLSKSSVTIHTNNQHHGKPVCTVDMIDAEIEYEVSEIIRVQRDQMQSGEQKRTPSPDKSKIESPPKKIFSKRGKKMACEFCSSYFFNQELYHKHLESHQKKKQSEQVFEHALPESCEVVDEMPKKKKAKSSNESPETIKCLLCSYKADTMEDLVLHRDVAHNTGASSPRVNTPEVVPDVIPPAETGVIYKCLYCRDDFPNDQASQRHWQVFHSHLQYKVEKIIPNSYQPPVLEPAAAAPKMKATARKSTAKRARICEPSSSTSASSYEVPRGDSDLVDFTSWFSLEDSDIMSLNHDWTLPNNPMLLNIPKYP